MTVPARPLEVNLDPNEMTLGELRIFGRKSFDPDVFCEFLEAHTNWTVEEINAIKISELQDVANQLIAALNKETVPLAN